MSCVVNKKVIAISGGSGSGKTTVANMLKQYYAEDAQLISLDSYYKDLSHLDKEMRSKINFDHPDSQDLKLLCDNVSSLKKGNDITVPEYCFETHTRKESSKKVVSSPIIILEGLYSFFDERLLKETDYKIFIDVSPDIRLIRRIRRDVAERGRSIDSILSQYESTVRNMYLAFIEKQKSTADIVIQNDDENSLQVLVDMIIKKLS